MYTRNTVNLIRIACISSLVLMVCWGLVLVLAQIRPFWTDEWRLIYNLKFKTHAQLWGPLEFTQQFPRVYLQFIKSVTSLFGYSYFIMRLPSFVIGTATILLVYRLMTRIYKPDAPTGFLFVFLIVSSCTFTDYFVQVKQYTMEIFLSLTAIWQLLEILEIKKGRIHNKWRYALLCFSFFAAPFFSYTYSIAVTPVFIVVFFQGILLLTGQGERREKIHTLLLQWAPFLIVTAGIILFYLVDVSRVLADKEMYGYWNYRMVSGGSGVLTVAGKIWDFYAQVGPGLMFEIIMGVLGIVAFVYSAYWWAMHRRSRTFEPIDMLRLYGLLVIVLALGLIVAGKLPVEPKFDVFTTPSIAIIVIFLLDALLTAARYKRYAGGLTAVLYLGLAGNMVVGAVNLFLEPEYSKRMKIYVATENAIIEAQKNNLPIIVTPGVAFPDEITKFTPHFQLISPAAVLKTFPAYKVSQNLPVYSATNLDEVHDTIKRLPHSVTAILAGDGLSYRVIESRRR